ncbi:alpha beta hydrolase family [Sporothrix brasiliensis 5110]|uniref:Alpha beta hydrolase family n=1 Tax=Sporothrix brasiliensis 5110 TaxID=1398154 RepID=A0A0C2IPL1_9PEZI|nr:alpha beta hydrolase family [Sporothrix brasiliensis 5110]KIH87012.1 alpha beta hydrolase family [Sporothrix brasiliensis 5110]
MLRSLILLAPAGLIRPQRFGVGARLIFTSGIVPERLLSYLTRRRLLLTTDEGTVNPLEVAVTETTDKRGTAAEPHAPEPQGVIWSLQVGRYVRWMLSHHDGFVPAIMSCIRDAPLVGQEASWTELARLVRGGDTADGERRLPLCIILGRHDNVVDACDYEKDALPMFGGSGSSNVTWTVVPGGHDFPMTYSRHVLRAIFDFWVEPSTTMAKLEAVDERELSMEGHSIKLGLGATANKIENGKVENGKCRPAGIESIP